MTFNELYNRTFITEADEDEDLSYEEELRNTDDYEEEASAGDKEEDPTPDKFEVEPVPIPKASPVDIENSNDLGDLPSEDSLLNYVAEINAFVTKLNSPNTNSLHKLISQLDTPGTAFEGISNNTAKSIKQAANALALLAQNVNSALLDAMRWKKKQP